MDIEAQTETENLKNLLLIYLLDQCGGTVTATVEDLDDLVGRPLCIDVGQPHAEAVHVTLGES